MKSTDYTSQLSQDHDSMLTQSYRSHSLVHILIKEAEKTALRTKEPKINRVEQNAHTKPIKTLPASRVRYSYD